MKIQTVNIDTDVEQVLRESQLKGNNLLLSGQLDRQLYQKTMKVLELIGFKWNRKMKCHVGEGDVADKFCQALAEGEVVNEKKTYQFFETPIEVADRLAFLSGISSEHRVLEPSAGKGAIIDAIFKRYPDLKVVFAIELNSAMAKFLNGKDAEEYMNRSVYHQTIVTCGDFLEHDEKYDRIVMNPPFSNSQDISHVMHAYDLLNDGGRLVAIMSPSWKYKSNRKANMFREWLDEHMNKDFFMEDLPAGTFSESGTEIATCIVVLSKQIDIKTN